MEAIDKNATCPCGSTKKYKHCCQRKEIKKASTLKRDTSMVPTWLQLAMQNLRQEKLATAKTLYEQILQTNPAHPDALQWLGVIHHKQGNSERAIELISRAIEIYPDNASAHGILGNVLKDMNQLAAAIDHYQKAIQIKPELADVYNNLGVALAKQGVLQEAVNSYRRAIALVPNYAEAWNNLGVALQKQGLLVEAEDAYKAALAHNPLFGQACFNLGIVLSIQKPDRALLFLQKAVELQPNFPNAWVAFGKLLMAQGNIGQARAAYSRCIELQPSSGVKIRRSLMLPPIMGTCEAVLLARQEFESNLEKLIAENLRFTDPLNEYCDTNFHLAYHGLNDRALQSRVASFYVQACPSLSYIAPHCKSPVTVRPKKRIGFVSKFITQHSVALSFSKIVENLAASGQFEVALISSLAQEDSNLERTYPDFQGRYIELPANLDGARHAIAALELDVLLYLDIGMEAFSYFLAFARLASVQCVLGGHPVTTGIPTMDYYLSSDMCEVEHAQDHYTEKLVRLPFGAFYFERPTLPATSKTRDELGLPPSGNLYVCPMTLHKLHPDFDVAMERVLQLDPTGYVVLFADKRFSNWQRQLEQRFAQTISSSVMSRVVFVPWVDDKLDFMRILESSDVVLDPFHFGIGTTAIPLCAAGTPFVTKPSEFLRGRVGLYYCELMGLMECVTQDLESYAAKAVSIANNPSERARLKTLILANNHVLFENKRAIEDVIDFLSTVTAQH